MKEDAVGSGRRCGRGAAGWYLAGGRKTRSSTSAGRPSACWRCGGTSWLPCAPPRRGSWTPALWGRCPGRAALESVRMEDGAAVLSLRGEGGGLAVQRAAGPAGVYSVPWRGSARPGVLYTEYLGSGWYAGYACLGWG